MKCLRCNSAEAIICEKCIYELQNQRNEFKAHIQELKKEIKIQELLVSDSVEAFKTENARLRKALDLIKLRILEDSKSAIGDYILSKIDEAMDEPPKH